MNGLSRVGYTGPMAEDRDEQREDSPQAWSDVTKKGLNGKDKKSRSTTKIHHTKPNQVKQTKNQRGI